MAWLHDRLGASGVYAIALVSGLTDVDAITLSSLRLFGMNSLTGVQAATSIVLALISNLLFKLGLVLFAGGMPMFRRCVVPMLAMVAAAGFALTIWR